MRIVELETSHIDLIRKIDKEWLERTEGKRTSQPALFARDRKNPGHYISIVLFDSYESAVTNANLFETLTAAAQYLEAISGPIILREFDILDDRR